MNAKAIGLLYSFVLMLIFTNVRSQSHEVKIAPYEVRSSTVKDITDLSYEYTNRSRVGFEFSIAPFRKGFHEWYEETNNSFGFVDKIFIWNQPRFNFFMKYYGKKRQHYGFYKALMISYTFTPNQERVYADFLEATNLNPGYWHRQKMLNTFSIGIALGYKMLLMDERIVLEPKVGLGMNHNLNYRARPFENFGRYLATVQLGYRLVKPQ